MAVHTKKIEFDPNDRIEVSFDTETKNLKFFIWDGNEGTRFEMNEVRFRQLSMLVQIVQHPTYEKIKPVKGMVITHPVTQKIPEGWKECTNYPRPVIELPGGALSVDNTIYLEYVGEN